VEKAREEMDLGEAEKLTEKILEARFDFNDFLKQTRMLKNMGSLGGIMKLIPGMGKMLDDDKIQQGERELKKVEAMIGSMTMAERKDPDLLIGAMSRCRRVAGGSGYKERDVAELVAKFKQMRSMMQQMGQGNFSGMGGFPGMGGGGPPQQKKPKKAKNKKGFGSL
jgi:signal recognition particle subunit SRP54